MEIRIGVTQTARELVFESNQSAADISSLVADALANERGVLSLADDKGNQYLVPTTTLAYIQIGTEETRRVGFVA